MSVPPGVNPAAFPQPKAENWLRAHEKLTKRVEVNDCPLLFVGDSITQHWLTQDRGREIWNARYKPLKAINIGKAGDRTENVLWRLQHGGLGKVQPKVTVLLIGINNTKSHTPTQIAGGIEAVVKELRADLPQTKILLLGVFPKGGANDPKRPDIKEINQRIAGLDDGKSVFFLDISGAFLDPSGNLKAGVMVDGLHPSPEGYAIWADAMQPKLMSLLGSSGSPSPAAP